MKPSEIAAEVELLHTIWLRNRLQHRAQMWWKYFDIFLRRVRQQARAKRYDQRALGSLRQLVPKFWRAMHDALASGAFLTIVFAVMASVARLSSLMGLNIKKPRANPISVAQQLGEDLGEIIVSEPASTTLDAPVDTPGSPHEDPHGDPLGSKLKSRAKPKSKGSMGSSIDDIFSKKKKTKRARPAKPAPRDAIDDIFG